MIIYLYDSHIYTELRKIPKRLKRSESYEECRVFAALTVIHGSITNYTQASLVKFVQKNCVHTSVYTKTLYMDCELYQAQNIETPEDLALFDRCWHAGSAADVPHVFARWVDASSRVCNVPEWLKRPPYTTEEARAARRRYYSKYYILLSMDLLIPSTLALSPRQPYADIAIIAWGPRPILS